MWIATIARAASLRAGLEAIDGLRDLAEPDLPEGAELDPTKVLFDISALGYDWLNEHHRVTVVLSDARHLLAVVAPGTTRAVVKALVDYIWSTVASTCSS